LRNVAGRRMTAAGVIVITARRFRTREQNRRDALSRLATLIERAAVPQKRRRPTRPSRAVRERRLEGKRRRGEVKKTRGQVGQDD
jgi:ribosome-associated protein